MLIPEITLFSQTTEIYPSRPMAFSIKGLNYYHLTYPCTGGCYDGLEENNVNLNQCPESTLSYLMARMLIEKNIALNDANK